MTQLWRGGMWLSVLGLLLLTRGASAQIILPVGTPSVAGVALDSEGMIRAREVEGQPNLALLRARVKLAEEAPKAEALTYVSLPRLLAQVRELSKAAKPIPQDLRCMGGLTQLRYVFVFPEQKDLVLAGYAEEIDATTAVEPVGKASGRPVLQLEDLIVALRTIDQPNGKSFFGCSIDTVPDALKKSDEVAAKYGNAPKAELLKRMADAIGPQKVSVINTAADTRLAFVMVAADFKLKRFTMGLETSPVVAIGNAVDNSRSAACRFWFAPSYEPLLVTAAGDAYAIRGARLQLKSGAQSFDERGATDKAKAFAKKFTENIPALAATNPLFADLQNIADMALLAALIRADKLDQKVGLDMDWAISSYDVTKVVVPRTTETQVNVTGGSVASGGVALSMMPLVGETAREKASDGTLAALKQRPTEGWILKASLESPKK